MRYLLALTVICFVGFISRTSHLILFGYPYNAGIDVAYHTSMIIWVAEQGISHIFESRPTPFPPSPPFLYTISQIFTDFSRFGSGILTVATLNVVEILSVYALSRHLSNRKRIGLLSALMVATSPVELIYVLNGWWHSSVAISLMPLCYLFCIRAIQKGKKPDILSGSILLIFLSLAYPIYYYPFLGGLAILCFLGKGNRKALMALTLSSLLASFLYFPIFIRRFLLAKWGLPSLLPFRVPLLPVRPDEVPLIATVRTMAAVSIPTAIPGALGFFTAWLSYRRKRKAFNDLASMTYLFPLVGLVFLVTNVHARHRFIHLIPVMMAIEYSNLVKLPNLTTHLPHINPSRKSLEMMVVLAILVSMPFSAILLNNSFVRMLQAGPKVLNNEKVKLIDWIRKKTPENSLIVLDESIFGTWMFSMHRNRVDPGDRHDYRISIIGSFSPSNNVYQLVFKTRNYQVHKNVSGI